jgi:hypothetical protein
MDYCTCRSIRSDRIITCTPLLFLLVFFSFFFSLFFLQRLLEVEKSGRLGIWSEFASHRRRSFLFGLRSLSDVHPNGLHFRNTIIGTMNGCYRSIERYFESISPSEERIFSVNGIITCIILCTATRQDPAERSSMYSSRNERNFKALHQDNKQATLG